MKILKLDYNYFIFPEGIKTVEEFVEFVNSRSPKFIKLTMLSHDNSVAPYFIEEDQKSVYINLSQVNIIEEINGHVMPRNEYECKLREVVREKCMTCIHFEGDLDNLEGHYGRLSLDGFCWDYENMNENEK